MNIEDIKCCGNCDYSECNSEYGFICVAPCVPENVARHVMPYHRCENDWKSDYFDRESRIELLKQNNRDQIIS